MSKAEGHNTHPRHRQTWRAVGLWRLCLTRRPGFTRAVWQKFIHPYNRALWPEPVKLLHRASADQPCEPLDVLKKVYQRELLSFSFDVVGSQMSKTQFFWVLIPAVAEAFTPDNIQKGFCQTGIYPVNAKVRKLKELGPSFIMDKCKWTVALGI